jgi:hypothetical protein
MANQNGSSAKRAETIRVAVLNREIPSTAKSAGISFFCYATHPFQCGGARIVMVRLLFC